jgi:hypothetical protein
MPPPKAVAKDRSAPRLEKPVQGIGSNSVARPIRLQVYVVGRIATQRTGTRERTTALTRQISCFNESSSDKRLPHIGPTLDDVRLLRVAGTDGPAD